MPKVSNGKSDKANIVEKYELDNIDQLLLRQLTEFPDTSASELARLINYSHTGTKKRLQKPALKKAVAEAQGSTDEHLQRAAHQAARKLSELINSDDPKISLKGCELALKLYNERMQGHDISPTEIIFKTRIGESGQLIQEVQEITVAEIFAMYPTAQ